MLGRFRGHGVGRLGLRARDTAGSEWVHVLDGCLRENPAIASVWARGQVRKLEDRYVVGRGNLDHLEKQIVAVSIRHHVLCRFTAYVAIDRSQAPNKAGKMHRITQPVEMPAGWEADRAESAMACYSLPDMWPGQIVFNAPGPSELGFDSARRPPSSPRAQGGERIASRTHGHMSHLRLRRRQASTTQPTRSRRTVLPISESQAETLDQVLKARSLTHRDSARWIAEIADAIQHLDAKGVVYRDLSPSAIMIGKDGSAKLTNLPTGGALRGEPSSVEIFGGLSYASPEEVAR